ncbi:MAG: polyketide cyclase [bacterium]|nr:polyketide cyclase [bacterium]
MITVTKTTFFNVPPNQVFKVITNNKEYRWRSDIKKIDEIESGRTFIEYTKKGIPTLFNITKQIPNKEYCFTMENNNLHGKWSGVLQEKERGTLLTLTEMIELKTNLLKPFAKHFLIKQQETYVNDLTKALTKEGKREQ